ncbi:hypothetical protein M3Y95_01229100 [Aphelenchoides besseyi]|nr:hypothetical protein M3Y95_01229100 [Aphelenchoides besseyi]
MTTKFWFLLLNSVAFAQIPRRNSNSAFGFEIVGFFGTPIQPTYLYVDLNAVGIWLFSAECSSCSHFSFNPNTSVTFQNQTTQSIYQFSSPLNDQKATLNGYIAQDQTLLVPELHSDDDTQTLKFTLITSLVGFDTSVSPEGIQYDGRVGLSPKQSDQNALNLVFGDLDRLVCFGQKDETWMEIGRKSLEQNVQYENLTSVATETDEWTFLIDDYSFGKFSSSGPFQVQLSTTTEFIYAPSGLINQIIKQLDAEVGPGDELEVDCDRTAPNFQVQINGVYLSVQPSDYIHRISNDKCVLQFRSFPNAKDQFVLGPPFLNSFTLCLDFDNQIVSFLDAKLKVYFQSQWKYQ